jgi:hypothetical protein
MAKDPAFLFYSSDFLVGTLTMTDEQVGKYIRLLCLQHQKGVLYEKDMLNICKSYDEDIFSKFSIEDGKYFNERLLSETQKRVKYSESRSNNRKSEKNNVHMNIISKTYDQHMENEIVNENINTNRYDYLKTSEILNSENEIGWRETVMQVSMVKTDLKLKVYLKEFLLIQKANNYFPHEISDTKRYFLNWVRTKAINSTTQNDASDVLESKMKVY